MYGACCRNRRCGRGCRKAGIEAVAIPQRPVIGIGQAVTAAGAVNIPIPHFDGIGPHTVNEIVGAVAVDAIPDLYFRTPACPVAPDEEVAAAELFAAISVLRRVLNGAKLARVPAGGRIAGIVLVFFAIPAAAAEDTLLGAVMERPLQACFTARIALGLIIAKDIIGKDVDAVIDRSVVGDIIRNGSIIGGLSIANLKIPV